VNNKGLRSIDDTVSPQAEAAALNNEQTYQALEQRYLLLSKELSQVVLWPRT
jgi:hypothetical protein